MRILNSLVPTFFSAVTAASALSLPSTARDIHAAASHPPLAYVDFCGREPQECAESGNELSQNHAVQWNFRTRDLVNRINREVNHSMVFADDDITYNQDEFWTLPEYRTEVVKTRSMGPGDKWETVERAAGDCEDYSLEKRRRLREAGIPSEATYIAVVVLPDERWHTVLLLKGITDDGQESYYVMDNRVDELLTMQKTDYFWVIKEHTSSSEWRFIANFGQSAQHSQPIPDGIKDAAERLALNPPPTSMLPGNE